MMNFLLGTVAGGIIACVATIAAARHPEVQSRLGLIPTVPATLAAAPSPPVEKRCLPDTTAALEQGAGRTEKLFERRRFWFVAP